MYRKDFCKIIPRRCSFYRNTRRTLIFFLDRRLVCERNSVGTSNLRHLIYSSASLKDLQWGRVQGSSSFGALVSSNEEISRKSEKSPRRNEKSQARYWMPVACRAFARSWAKLSCEASTIDVTRWSHGHRRWSPTGGVVEEKDCLNREEWPWRSRKTSS